MRRYPFLRTDLNGEQRNENQMSPNTVQSVDFTRAANWLASRVTHGPTGAPAPGKRLPVNLTGEPSVIIIRICHLPSK